MAFDELIVLVQGGYRYVLEFEKTPCVLSARGRYLSEFV